MRRVALILLLVGSILPGCLSGSNGSPDAHPMTNDHQPTQQENTAAGSDPQNDTSTAPEPHLDREAPATGAPGGPAAPPNWAERALPSGEGHDHSDPAQHADLSTPNLKVLGWDPLTPSGEYLGSHACGGVGRQGGRTLAVVAGYGWDGAGSPRAFSVVDVTDPARPQLVGGLDLPNTMVLDATIAPDGRFVVVAVAASDRAWVNRVYETATDPTSTQTTSTTPVWHDACGSTTAGPETQLTYPQGLLLVDLADPGNPRIVDTQPMPLYGPHSVTVTEAAGTTYVLSSVTNLVYEASYFVLHTIEAPRGTARLVPHSVIDPEDPGFADEDGGENDLFPFGDLPSNRHVDGALQVHPITGDLIAYLANWNMGLEIVRVEDRGQTRHLARWTLGDWINGEPWEGNIHTVLPMPGTRNGKHYTFVGQEVITQPDTRPTGEVYMLDTTDPAAPALVARWTLPVEVGWDDNLVFSPHYVALSGETLFVSLYHGGLWAVGTEPVPGTDQLPTLGVLVPDRGTDLPAPTNASEFAWAPVVQEVLTLPGGQVVAFDGHSGAYTVSYEPNVPVPVPDPWPYDG